MSDDLTGLPVDELRMALADWKRWRNHVRTAKSMRRRVERFEQACLQIAAIEQELALRAPEVRERLRREATATLRAIVRGPVVPLDAYRSVRVELAEIQKRRSR